MKKQRHNATSTKTIRNTFFFVGIPLVSLCATFILLYVATPVRYQAPAPALVVPAVKTKQAQPIQVLQEPVTLEIKSIGVDAKINPVGLTVDGDMAIEENAQELAWFKPGQKPGETGSAVIAGHYGWKDGVPSVFNDLNILKVGAVVSTYDAKGGVRNFAVTAIRMYNPDDDATQVFVSTDGKAHLNLITCQGSWNNTEQTYSERLVVFTDEIKD